MAYDKPTLIGYNANPPPDNGLQTAANRVDWAKHIDKIGDPLRVYADAINNSVDAALFETSPTLASIATMQAIASPLDGASVTVTEEGRGGVFVFDTSLTAAANNGTTFKATDATVGSWARRFSGALNIRWFGAQSTALAGQDSVGDPSGFDSTPFIQAALTTGWTERRSVFIPAGVYRITDTLEVTSPTVNYRPAHVFGEGRGYTQQAQSVIDSRSVTQKPALHISAGLGVVLEDFAIYGPNLAPDVAVVGECYYDFAWVTPGLRDEQYSPQCGICIDGNSGVTPPDGGYPGFTYRGNANPITAVASKDIVLNRIMLRNNVVGLMISPGLSANADVIAINDCQIWTSKCCIAVGQVDAKNTVMRGGNLAYSRTGYEGLEYGRQMGRGPLFFGTQLAVLFEMVSWNSAMGPAVFSNCAIEQVHSIGYGGVSTNSSEGIYFYGSTMLNFSDAGTPGAAPIKFDGRYTPFHWFGGSYGVGLGPGATDRVGVAHNFVCARAVFDSVTLRLNDIYKPFVQGPAGLTHPFTMRNVRAASSDGSVYYGADRLVGTALSGRVVAHHDSPVTTVTPYNAASTTYDYVRTVNAGELAAFTSSTYTFAATTMTFEVSADVALNFLIDDVVYWRMNEQGASVTKWVVPALRVTNVTGTTVTCEYLFRRVDYDETYSPGASTYIAVVHWAPGEELTADTNTSTSLTNVSPTTILRNGDWIMGATGISANTRVVSGGGTATITLNRAATDTAVGKPLYFDRLHTRTTTAAF